MNVIVVDDERMAREGLRMELANIPEITGISLFDDPEEALLYAAAHLVDVAFLDVEMYGMNGLILAKRLKEVQPRTNIVFVTGYSQYAIDAFSLAASDYLLKPVGETSIRRALESLRHPVRNEDRELRVRCFGNFEVFFDNIPLHFARSKTKELLAYLVNRSGAWCTNNEIVATIWEGRLDSRSLQVQYRQLVSDLTAILREKKAEGILLKRRGALALLTEKVSCDYFDFLKGGASAINSYRGEFMEQYSWAEFTKGMLERNF